MSEKLYIVVPCYNEEEVLPETSKKLKEKLESLIERDLISPESKIVFVNDGSKDRTWPIILELHKSDPHFSGICLTRNRGHQNALMAGLMECRNRADIIISMDADLQDDIGAVDQMLEEYRKGNDIVYGVRSSRKTDTFFKRFTAESYYKVMRMLGVELVFNHADYRLLSRRALDGLAEYKEVNLFLRGIVPQIGYDTAIVTYERKERFAGESKYPLKKMLAFAFDGITSFSINPIRMISALGFLIALLAAVLFVVFFVQKLCGGSVVMGWASTICSIWLLGGLQLLAIGVVGEYIGKIYLEVKQRPKFIIEQYLD